MPTIAILGSTGSIGRMTLEVCASLGSDYRVVALAAGRQVDLLARQAAETGARTVAVCDDKAAEALRQALPEGAAPEILVGRDGLVALASRDDVDIVVSAVVGGAGLPAALAAVRAGKRLALANKEALVMAGELVMAEAAPEGYKELGKIDFLDGPQVWGPLAVSNGELLLRDDKQLLCISLNTR